MHSIAFVLLPTDVTDIRQTAKALLAPYHIELEVQPYKAYFSVKEVKYWAEKFGTEDLRKIAENLRLPNNGGMDVIMDDVGLFMMDTFNQRGRFDYWNPAELFEETSVSSKFGKDLSRSICLVSQLLNSKDSIPFSIIAPEGEWFCAKDQGVVPLYDFEGQHHLNHEAQTKWEHEARMLFAKYPNHLVFALDVHS